MKNKVNDSVNEGYKYCTEVEEIMTESGEVRRGKETVYRYTEKDGKIDGVIELITADTTKVFPNDRFTGREDGVDTYYNSDKTIVQTVDGPAVGTINVHSGGIFSMRNGTGKNLSWRVYSPKGIRIDEGHIVRGDTKGRSECTVEKYVSDGKEKSKVNIIYSCEERGGEEIIKEEERGYTVVQGTVFESTEGVRVNFQEASNMFNNEYPEERQQVEIASAIETPNIEQECA
ncbi:MAG: hypothetical protein A2Y24_07835 [Clostridiales bacterium GWE2_32_10]|nr:MAG: hypothetical protein A2Y24_07835 [Clostridiales bacterium GWE2_32_10]HBY21368.1 hypothetical protein [Clostridiales bacterium]